MIHDIEYDQHTCIFTYLYAYIMISANVIKFQQIKKVTLNAS